MMTRAPEHQSTRAPEFLVSFLFSLFLNLGLLFFLPYLGKATNVKVYKAYKINLVKLLEEKKVIAQKPKPIVQKPSKEKQEPQLPFLPIEEEKEEVKIEEAIPITKEEKPEQAHIIIPVAQEEQKSPEIFEATSLDYPLKILSFIQPKYPVAAKEKEIEGIVKIRLLINPDGIVEKAEIISENPKGFDFGKEALKVVKDYRFTHPLVSTKPVFVYYILPLRFSLEE